MNKISVGILGNGFIGSMHYEEVGKIKGLEVISVADTNPEVLRGLDLGVHPYTDYNSLLKEHPDAVIVALPDRLHLQAIEAIAEISPKSIILLEKPLASNLGDALKLKEVIEREGIRTMVGLTGHYHPEFRMAYEILARIGKVQDLDERIHLGAENFPAQNYLPVGGRGIVIENGTHTFDRFMLFSQSRIDLGSITLDFIDDRNFGRKCDDNAAGNLRTENNIPARFSFAWYPYHREDYVFTVNGESGKIQVRGFKDCKIILKGGTSQVLFEHDISLSLRDRHRPGINAELRDFKGFIEGSSTSLLLAYAFEAQNVIEKIYEIAKVRVS